MCASVQNGLAAPALDVEIGEGSFPLTVDVRFKFGHSKPFTHIRMALWKGTRSSDLRLTWEPDQAILYSAKPFILRFGEKPRIFDLRRRAFAAQDIGDFARRVSLAVDIRFVRVRRRVAGDDDVGQS